MRSLPRNFCLSKSFGLLRFKIGGDGNFLAILLRSLNNEFFRLANNDCFLSSGALIFVCSKCLFMNFLLKLKIVFLLVFINILGVFAENVYTDNFGYLESPLFFGISKDYPKESIVKWDFGDQNFESGRETVHRYKKLGEYEVKTTIKNNYLSETVINKVNIIRKSGILISEIDETKTNTLQKFALLNDFYIQNISTQKIGNDTLKNLSVKEKINNDKNLNKYEYIILWTNNNNLLDLTFRLDKHTKRILKGKTLIYITDDIDNINLQRKISNIGFKNSLITSKEAIYDLIEIQDYSKFLKYIKDRDYKHQEVNHNIVIKKPLLLLSIISNYLTEKGLSSDILYLTLLLPIIFGIISIAHNIIGLELISKYSITTFILGALITNIETMLVLTLVAIALSLLNKLTFDKLNLLSIPKENLNIGIYSIASLLVIFLLNYFNLLANQDINTVIVAIRLISPFHLNLHF